jgi:hypothetical protein
MAYCRAISLTLEDTLGCCPVVDNDAIVPASFIWTCCFRQELHVPFHVCRKQQCMCHDHSASVAPLRGFHYTYMSWHLHVACSDLMAAREAQHAAKVQAARARQAEEAVLAASVRLESQRQTAAAQAIVRVLPATRCMLCTRMLQFYRHACTAS